MLKFERNKVVGVERKDANTLLVHGILDDNIYSIQLNVTIGLTELNILDIEGWWNRWTTPGCPRAIGFLREAVGLSIEEKGFFQKVHKIIGRKACRHFANLLSECCNSAKEEALMISWEEAQKIDKGLLFEDFLKGNEKNWARSIQAEKNKQSQPTEYQPPAERPEKEKTTGMVIDLHVHTASASPCSSAQVDQLIEEAKRIGLDGICLTDHNHVWDPEAVEKLKRRHSFLILRGNEITTDQGDMLVFGLENEITGIIKLEELRKQVLEVGGFMIVAHPFRGFLIFNTDQLGLTPEKAMKRGLFKYVDAVEVLNSKVTKNENNLAAEVALQLGLNKTGGSDAHEVSEVGVYATRFLGEVNDEKSLIAALKKGEYEPVIFRKQENL